MNIVTPEKKHDEDYLAACLLQTGVFLLRGGFEISCFENFQDAGAFIQHFYGHLLGRGDIKLVHLKNRVPQPGDAIVADRDRLTGMLEVSHGELTVCQDAVRVFRQGNGVHCEGGPTYPVSVSSLKFAGLKRVQYWMWGRGFPGENEAGIYETIVPVWRWDGTSKSEQYEYKLYF